jgi:pimeloyl-ACP methyl ester carboxylesterase
VPRKNPKKAVLFFHGITWTRYGALKYEKTFREFGYGALIVDLRFHGATGGKNCSSVFHENYDARAWVDWLETELGENATIGTHGESLGAAVALQHAAIDDRVVLRGGGLPVLGFARAARLSHEKHDGHCRVTPACAREYRHRASNGRNARTLDRMESRR